MLRLRGRLGLMVAGLAALAVACTSAAAPGAGEQVTDRTFTMFDGQEASLTTTFAGQPLFVNFWASWCAPCIQEMPDIERLHQELGDQVTFIGFNLNDQRDRAEEMKDFTGVTFLLAEDPDGEVYADFGGFTMPMTYLVDESGTIVDSHGGLGTQAQFREMIERHLLG
jgi:thiol-disulfide isomerase/thioredoxin